MHNHYLKLGSTRQNGTPFICRFKPFVGFNYPVIKPFIRSNMPLVSNRGITLVELIIVLTIAGVLGALAAPSIQKMVSSNRLTFQINDLLADISIARSEAIKRSTTAGVCVTALGGSACVTTGNWANGWLVYYFDSVASANVTMKVHDALENKNTLTFPNDDIVFTKSGLVSGITGNRQFTLSDPKTAGARIVCVAPTGRPALSKVTCP